MQAFRWDNAPDVMGVKDVMRALNASDAAVRKLFRDGEIKAVKVGKGWRCSKQNVIEFVNGGSNA